MLQFGNIAKQEMHRRWNQKLDSRQALDEEACTTELERFLKEEHACISKDALSDDFCTNRDEKWPMTTSSRMRISAGVAVAMCAGRKEVLLAPATKEDSVA